MAVQSEVTMIAPFRAKKKREKISVVTLFETKQPRRTWWIRVNDSWNDTANNFLMSKMVVRRAMVDRRSQGSGVMIMIHVGDRL
jgi:hypothetical protein